MTKHTLRSLTNGVMSTLLALTLSCTKKEETQTTNAGNTGIAGNADVLKIGEVGSLTGSEATFGVSTHQGIELAINEVNAAGGVKGKKLQVITMDNQGKPEEAATATTKTHHPRQSHRSAR